jgi:predicted AAA+ superfamily ATPase
MFYYSKNIDGTEGTEETEGTFVAASNVDTICINDLNGYDDVRKIIIDNTEQFLNMKTERGLQNATGANNMLLYGDRGCGKSATVKAICNDFAPRGLRLIEIKKNQLTNLNEIIEKIKNRNLKFILFIDDLSFENGAPEFNILKAYLEGGIEKRPANIVVYATSNRRHLVKESATDRPASHNDVRAFDTMAEQLSLADRFGVTVIFLPPTQDEFLRIAEFLGLNKGVIPQGANAETLQKFRDNALRWE